MYLFKYINYVNKRFSLPDVDMISSLALLVLAAGLGTGLLILMRTCIRSR